MASAKRKRNLKTHPRVRGENDPDDNFSPPDRPDVIANSEMGPEGEAEVIDFSKPTEMIDTAGEREETPPRQAERREPPAEPAPARRQEREDRASRRQARGTGESEEDADDRRGYSARVRARIARERAVVNRERALREQADRKLEEERVARQELAERIAKIERSSTKVAADADVKALKAQIDALKPQIASAVEAGETAKALDLQIRLGDLQADLKVKEYDLTLRAQNAAVLEESQRQQREAKAAADARAKAAGGDEELAAEHLQRGNEFKRANRHWWRRDKDAREAARVLDLEILDDIKEGDLDFEAYSDEHFEELAERLHADFPELEICDLEREPYDFGDEDTDTGERDSERRGARVTNGNQRGNGARSGNRAPTGRLGTQRQATNEVEMARKGQVRLTAEDYKEMRIFKLDPNNPRDKKYFAEQRARTILSEAAKAEQNRGAR